VATVGWHRRAIPPGPAGRRQHGAWPGLTIYRFTSPTGPSWEEIRSLSLCIVAQGRKAVTVDGATYEYDPFRYLVLNSHLHFQAEILEATPAKPFRQGLGADELASSNSAGSRYYLAGMRHAKRNGQNSSRNPLLNDILLASRIWHSRHHDFR
jgi:hypothetical protein